MKVSFVPLPELYLKLGNLADELVACDTPVMERDLRKQDQKKAREMHQAAIFARAIQGAFSIEPTEMIVGFPEDEYCPFDTILLWKKQGEVTRLNVQLKELPPERLAPKTNINEIIGKVIKKLPRSPDVLVAIFANRGGDAQQVEIPHHELAGVCAYGFNGLIPRTIFVVGYIGDTRLDATVPLKFALPQ